jgi:ketopantoate hydroxymethyltransferase
MAHALAAFRADVESRAFPAPEHTVEMPEEEWEAFLTEIE